MAGKTSGRMVLYRFYKRCYVSGNMLSFRETYAFWEHSIFQIGSKASGKNIDMGWLHGFDLKPILWLHANQIAPYCYIFVSFVRCWVFDYLAISQMNLAFWIVSCSCCFAYKFNNCVIDLFILLFYYVWNCCFNVIVSCYNFIMFSLS